MKRWAIILAGIILLLLVLVFVFMQRPPADRAHPGFPPPKEVKRAPRPPPPATEVDLGSTLSLDSLSECARSPALASIIEALVRFDPRTFESRRGGPIRVPGFDRPLSPTFERTREIDGNADIRAVVADLDIPGRWHGLAVIGLRRSFYEESDVGAFQIRFSEPPERVRDTLMLHGFNLAPIGEVREFDEEGQTTYIGIERADGGSALTCGSG